MDKSTNPKYTIELKQTANGIWYLGSLKLDVESFEKFNNLIDDIIPKIEWKINELNNNSTSSKDNNNNPNNNNHNSKTKKEMISEQEKEKEKEKEEILLNPEDERLFNHLKEIRLELARKEGYPPYIIFHDSALRQMAVQKPVSFESMKELIGEKRFEKYGKIFVKEIFQFE